MKWVHLKTIDSTNNFAKKLIKNNWIKSFTTISAEKQLKGRGTKGRVWYSQDKGGLYMSCVITTITPNDIKPEKLVVDIATLIQTEIKKMINIPIDVEWPNDLMLSNKKLGGILMEYIQQDKSYLIIGIGLNINQSIFPGELSKIATSLKIHTERTFCITDIICSISKKIKEHYKNNLN